MLIHVTCRLALLVLAVVVFSACSDEGPEANPYIRVLELLPDTPEVTRNGVTIGDLATARGLTDVVPPEFGADGRLAADLFASYVLGLPTPARDAQFLTPATYVPFMEQAHQSLGINLLEADQWFVVLTDLPGFSAVSGLTGPFEATAIDASLEACTDCAEPVLDERRGEWVLRGWGEDASGSPPDTDMRFAPPLYDNLGFGGRVAFQDGAILRAAALEPLHLITNPDLRSLADVEAYRTLAREVHAGGALVATLFPADGGRISASSDSVQGGVVREIGGEYLGPFGSWASGQGYDTETGLPYNILVLLHETEDAAKRNAELLPGRLAPAVAAMRSFHSNDFGHDGDSRVDVETDGRVLIATIEGTKESLGYSNQVFIAYLVASE